jgi:SAM-dependent methyltransferase
MRSNAEVGGPLTEPEVVRPFRYSWIAHSGRTILGPLDGSTLDALLDAAPLPPGARVLDVGCGKGDLLVRLAPRSANGIGIDHNPAFIADARELAAEAGVADRLTFVVGGAAAEPLPRDLDLVACVGATQALGGPVRAPVAMAGLVRPGGFVVIGEAFWSANPTPEQLASFGVEPGEMLGLAGTIARMTNAELEFVASAESTPAEWDSYEDDYAGAIERWAADNPDDPDRTEFLARAAFFRSSWTEWRRDAMGFTTVLLRRPGG